MDPLGNQIWNNIFLNSDVDVTTMALTGTYYLSVEGRRNQLGTNQSVTFNIRKVTDDATPIAIETDVAGNIAIPGQIDRYTFSLSEAKLLYMDARADFQVFWSLVSSTIGTFVGGKNFQSTDSSDGLSVLNLGPGDYTLVFDASADITGAYAFRLLDIAAAPVITPGTPVSASLNPANQTDVYRLNVTAGDRYFFDIQSIQIADGTWRLINQYGDLIANTYIGSDFGEITLPLDGPYFLVVEGRRYATGSNNYTFNVELRGNTPPVPLAGTAISLGDLVTGSIDAAAEVDQYVFTVASPTMRHVRQPPRHVRAVVHDRAARHGGRLARTALLRRPRGPVSGVQPRRRHLSGLGARADGAVRLPPVRCGNGHGDHARERRSAASSRRVPRPTSTSSTRRRGSSSTSTRARGPTPTRTGAWSIPSGGRSS